MIGTISTELRNTRADRACNMPVGELIADAMLAATQAADFGGAKVALMNGGGVRNPGLIFASSSAGEGDGNVTYGEAFTVQPFGNSLVTMTLTAQDLKDVLEEQFAGYKGQSATATRVMLPSAGFKYTWDGARACNSRISHVSLRTGSGVESIVDAAGVVTDPARRYRVTVNNFMADGGDGYSTFAKGAGPPRRSAGHRCLDGFHGAPQGAGGAVCPGCRPAGRRHAPHPARGQQHRLPHRRQHQPVRRRGSPLAVADAAAPGHRNGRNAPRMPTLP